jgi:Fe-S-cluster containining protein
MESLDAELERARDLDVAELADAIETIGFECTRCGACCKSEADQREASVDANGEAVSTADEGCGGSESDTEGGDDGDPHTATVFPDEIRRLQETGDYDFRDVARPMPYGIEETADGPQGETFEWALQTDDCGDCTFYEERDGEGACTVHADRPLICRTYPFSVALGGTSQPMGEAVDSEGMVRAHECEGLGRDISRTEAEELAAIGVRENYESTDVEGVVVHDSEGQKRPDGTPL